MALSEAPPSIQEGFLKKHRNLLFTSLALIIVVIVVIVLISPVIASQYTITETRTRNLQYDSGMYFNTNSLGVELYPPYVNVTNQDSIGGVFSVTINYNYNSWNGPELYENDTWSQSTFINAGTTQMFSPPQGWGFLNILSWSYNYSVSAPTTQENYNVTQTKYESILTLIENSLG